MPRRQLFGWRSLRLLALPIVLSVTLSVAVVLNSAPSKATPGHGNFVDYSWVPVPDSIAEMQVDRPYQELPALLDQACNGNEYDNTYGEDYMGVLLSKVELLRMIGTQQGRDAIQYALKGDKGKPVIKSPTDAVGCLTELDMDWSYPWNSTYPSTHEAASWVRTVEEGILPIPAFFRAPGTDANECGRRSNVDGDWDFSTAMLMRIWLLARPHLLPSIQSRIDAAVSQRAWLQGGRQPIDTAVCNYPIGPISTPYEIPETENHTFLIEVTRYLHNAYLPRLSPANTRQNPNIWVNRYDYYAQDTNNQTNGLTADMTSRLRSFLDHDFLEYNARPYSFNQMIGLTDLYDFAPDPQVRGLARAMLDMLASKVATESQGELRSEPFRRRFVNYWAPLYGVGPKSNGEAGSAENDAVTPMMQVWVGNLAPDRTPPNSTGEAAWAASTFYRPPDVLADLMLNPQHHIYKQGYNGQGQDERAYGQPDFTISGGGQHTNCPYPNPSPVGPRCPGGGNDSGTVMPIELIPRIGASFFAPNSSAAAKAFHTTARQSSAVGLVPSPTIGSVINGQNNTGLNETWNSCIGSGYACAASFADASPTWTKCRSQGNYPDGTKDLALLFDSSCVTTPNFPADSCFMTYTRSFKFPGLQYYNLPNPSLAVLTTHECGNLKSNPAALFEQFTSYFRGPGIAPSSCNVIDNGGFSLDCGVALRMPSSTAGAIRVGKTSAVHVDYPIQGFYYGTAYFDGTVRHYITGDADWKSPVGGDDFGTPSGVANGNVASFGGSGDNRKLVVGNYWSGEFVVDSLNTKTDGGATRSYDPRTFKASTAATPEGGNDQIDIATSGITHPEAVTAGEFKVWDSSGTLVQRVLQTYGYGQLASGAYNIQLPVSADPNHTYKVQTCYEWFRFNTSEDYRTNQIIGSPPTNGPSVCKTTTATFRNS